jgi:hypothetical protein
LAEGSCPFFAEAFAMLPLGYLKTQGRARRLEAGLTAKVSVLIALGKAERSDVEAISDMCSSWRGHPAQKGESK